MEVMGQKLTDRLMITGVNGWPVDVILTQRFDTVAKEGSLWL